MKWSIALGALLLMGGYLWLASGGEDAGLARHPVERKPLVIAVAGDGTLESAQSIHISCPRVPRMWQFTIAFLAPEGQAVKQDMPLIRFDDKVLRDRLNLAAARLETERKNLEKKKLQEKESLERLTLARAEQEVAVAKLERKLQTPEELLTRHEIQETRYDLELAQAKLKLAKTQERNQQESMISVIKNQELLIQQLSREHTGLNDAMESMTIKAPKDGLLVYKDNHGNKPAVGDSVWFGSSLLELPDLNQMRVAAVIDEPDAGKVAVGQPVDIRIDANPDRVYKGEIESLGTIFRQRSRFRPEIVFDAVVTIRDRDPELMRPGMAAKLEITVARTEPVLQIPESAVFFDTGGTFVQVVGPLGKESKRPVVLGRRAEGFVEVLQGLSEGETVLLEKGEEEAAS